MRFRYTTAGPTQDKMDGLPWLPLTLHYENQTIKASGLVDSGAAVNVLPYRIGLQLGARWNTQKAVIRLAGNLGNIIAQPFFPMAEIGDYPAIRLAFAWCQSDDAPLILGQMNFFMEFDICFYRSQLEFEVKPKER